MPSEPSNDGAECEYVGGGRPSASGTSPRGRTASAAPTPPSRGRRRPWIKQRLLDQLNLPASQTLTLEQSEAEGYLLDPAAILSAFPEKIPLTEERLEKRLAPFRRKR